jgi:anti-anti-sigma factor
MNDRADARASDGEGGSQLSLRVEDDAGRTFVTVAGEVDMESAAQLRSCLRTLDGNVVVDLAEVTFLDSSGIAALVNARKRLLDLGGTLMLRAPRSNVREVIRITGLDELLV